MQKKGLCRCFFPGTGIKAWTDRYKADEAHTFHPLPAPRKSGNAHPAPRTYSENGAVQNRIPKRTPFLENLFPLPGKTPAHPEPPSAQMPADEHFQISDILLCSASFPAYFCCTVPGRAPAFCFVPECFASPPESLP